MSTIEEQYGWTAVPHSLDAIIASRPSPTKPLPLRVEDIALPDTPLVHEVQAYAREHLPKETYAHSMRVYYFGTSFPLFPDRPFPPDLLPTLARAITLSHFHSFHHTPETLLLVCLLHDLGTTPYNLTSTHLSFEFHGAFLSLNLLKSLSSPIPQAESVAETIIRHQDLGETGMLTELTAAIHFGTLLDNAGKFAELVDRVTIESVVEAWPRGGWTGCFAHVLREEMGRKPWCNSTRIEGFVGLVEGNGVMAEFD
ncbi:hypothetical protein B0A48_02840 [Cryoendolithus antarcticus]|uniref:Uncharacterized protein n=1 Tax=Cryoendolithus antarcticus TaxID=1507870 RepID=A0A1V8TLE9_9PEZI|nr:hypothetical protein B0A48_02840 [Cryoendolithus antarcticus]